MPTSKINGVGLAYETSGAGNSTPRAVHEFRTRRSRSLGGAFACLRTARAAEQRAVRPCPWPRGSPVTGAPSTALRGEMCMTTIVGHTRG
jgi:hypothetical protein